MDVFQEGSQSVQEFDQNTLGQGLEESMLALLVVENMLG
jgi:hypothetical protein